MKPKLKTFFIVSAKNAINAILTNAGLMAMFSQTFELHTRAGVLNLAKATLLTVATREALVWGPKLLAWSQSTEETVSPVTGIVKP
jgi:hypothetical protein